MSLNPTSFDTIIEALYTLDKTKNNEVEAANNLIAFTEKLLSFAKDEVPIELQESIELFREGYKKLKVLSKNFSHQELFELCDSFNSNEAYKGWKKVAPFSKASLMDFKTKKQALLLVIEYSPPLNSDKQHQLLIETEKQIASLEPTDVKNFKILSQARAEDFSLNLASHPLEKDIKLIMAQMSWPLAVRQALIIASTAVTASSIAKDIAKWIILSQESDNLQLIEELNSIITTQYGKQDGEEINKNIKEQIEKFSSQFLVIGWKWSVSFKKWKFFLDESNKAEAKRQKQLKALAVLQQFCAFKPTLNHFFITVYKEDLTFVDILHCLSNTLSAYASLKMEQIKKEALKVMELIKFTLESLSPFLEENNFIVENYLKILREVLATAQYKIKEWEELGFAEEEAASKDFIISLIRTFTLIYGAATSIGVNLSKSKDQSLPQFTALIKEIFALELLIKVPQSQIYKVLNNLINAWALTSNAISNRVEPPVSPGLVQSEMI